MATKLGKPIMLDANTSFMCMQSWGRFNSTCALIDLRADQPLEHFMVILIPSVEDKEDILHTIRIEYE